MKKVLIGLAIILLGFFFRFNNLNWDSNYHLHPDERFLTMVGDAMKLPTSLNQYFNQQSSLLNPANVGFNFFVYGRFPLIITKYLAVDLGMDNYNDLTIIGRALSGFFDLMIVVLVFKTVFLFEKKHKLPSEIKYWAAFFYAIAVLPIQQSHFYTTDNFMNFFMFGSFYFALRYSYSVVGERYIHQIRFLLLSALFFGLALACKVTALFILPLNLSFLVKPVFARKQFVYKAGILISLTGLVSYFTLRLADPYLFAHASFFNPAIDQSFVANLKSLSSYLNKNVWYPPGVQWINKNPLPFSMINLSVFGVGIPYFMLVVVGVSWVISNIKDQIAKLHIKNQKEKNNQEKKQWGNFDLQIILIWVLAFVVYQGVQFNPGMRYFLIIYPFLAIFAGIGTASLIKKIQKYLNNKLLFSIFYFLFLTVLLIWPIMFSSIYFHKNTRVESSEWIYQNLPGNSLILGESWDDSLPMGVIKTFGKQFATDQLPIFDPDTPEKWQRMNEMLAKADYYVLSSNRGWGSIPTVPEKYPLTAKFYSKLLSNQLQYKMIKEFTSYPQINFQFSIFNFHLVLPDQWSEEAFTVYDHPVVMIYKNEKLAKKTF